jgi:hypothetical protein
VGALAVLASGCPSEEEPGGQPCTVNADCESLGMEYTCAQGVCVAPSATTGMATTEPQTDSSSSGESTSGSSSTTMAPTSGDPSSNSGTTVDPDADNCDPDTAPFLLEGGTLANSVSFDFAAMSCAVTQLGGQDPRILFEVRETTGRIDATAFGIEITDASVGQVFDDPPMGDSQVIDMPLDLAISFTGTAIADGTPLNFEFEVFSGGPALIDCAATFD